MKFPKKDMLEAQRIFEIHEEDFDDNKGQLQYELEALEKFISSDENEEYISDTLSHLSTYFFDKGFYTRILNNDLSYFTQALSTSTRLSFLEEQIAGLAYPGPSSGLHVFDMLKAIAIKETAVLNAYVTNFPPPFKGGHQSTMLLCNGLYAALGKHNDSKAVAEKLQTRKESKFFRAMYDCLYGLMESDSKTFKRGYEEIIKGNRTQAAFSSLEKMISLTAHAFKHLYEERKELDQSIFLANQKLPFDQELNDILTEDFVHTTIDLSYGSQVLEQWVKGLPENIDPNELLVELKGNK